MSSAERPNQFVQRHREQRELGRAGAVLATANAAAAAGTSAFRYRPLVPTLWVSPEERDELYRLLRKATDDLYLHLSALGRDARKDLGLGPYLHVFGRRKDGYLLAAVRTRAGGETPRYVRSLSIPPIGGRRGRTVRLRRQPQRA